MKEEIRNAMNNRLKAMYQDIYRGLEEIADERARASATATILIASKDVKWFTVEELTGEVGFDRPVQKYPLPPKKWGGKIDAVLEPMGENYNGENWLKCKCGNESITHHKKDNSGTYQACYDCRLFLNADGSTKAMKGK